MQINLKEAISIIASRLSANRRATLPLKNNVPSHTFSFSFRRRHVDRLSFGKRLRQEPKRFLAVNADVLSTHYATLERFVEDHGLDTVRKFQLYECSTTPGMDLTGIGAVRRLLPRHGPRDMRGPSFKYQNRVSMMPVISANGSSPFVFKSSKLPYRTDAIGGIILEETPACNLPYNSTLSNRADNDAVDTDINFGIYCAIVGKLQCPFHKTEISFL